MTIESGNASGTAHKGEAALESMEGEIASLEGKPIPPYTYDAVHVATTVYATVPRTAQFMEDIARMPTLDIKPIERLPIYAHALLHTHALVLSHSPETSTFDAEAAEARVKRELMLLTADVLVARGRVSKKTVDDIRAGTGNRDLVNDVIALHALLVPYADVSIPAAELAEIDALADRLTHALAQRNGEDPELAPLLLKRRKVAALLAKAYKDLTAAVAFLRRDEEDGSDFTPTLYVTGTRSKSDKDAAENPAAPKPSPAGPVAPAAPTKPSDARNPSDNPFDDKK